MKNLLIGTRFLLILGTVAAGMLAVGANGLLNLRSSVMVERQQALRSLSDVAVSMVSHYTGLAERGEMPKEQAQRAALTALRGIRYSGAEYFFVLAGDGTMLMHPIAEQLNGQGVLDFQDKAGKRLFSEMLDLARRDGSGFVPYQWPKPGRVEAQPKLSFVRAIPQWQWVIGTGVYIDDVDADFLHNAWLAGAIGLLITAGITVFALAVGRGITGPLAVIAGRMTDLAHGKLAVDVPYTDHQDEIGDLARALQVFKDTAIAETAKMAEVSRRWNRALSQPGNQGQILQVTCDILSKTGGFTLVWVDAVSGEPGRQRARQVALSTQGVDALELLDINWNSRGGGSSPTEATLATGQMFCCQDVIHDSRLDGWRHEKLLHRHAAFATLPINDGARLVGVLNLYAPLPNAFSPLTLSMLGMMAGNLVSHLEGAGS